MDRTEWVSVLGTSVLLIRRDQFWTWAMDIRGTMQEADASFGSAAAALAAAGATVFYLWLAEELSAITVPIDPLLVRPHVGKKMGDVVPPPQGGGGG